MGLLVYMKILEISAAVPTRAGLLSVVTSEREAGRAGQEESKHKHNLKIYRSMDKSFRKVKRSLE